MAGQDYSITRFMGYLDGHVGLSHSNRYFVELSFPEAMGGQDAEGLNLICSSASMPGHPILTAEKLAFGNPVPVPYSFGTEEAEFTFLLDGEYKAMKAFDAWAELIVNNKTHVLAYKNEIIAPKWVVWQLDTNNERTSGVTLYNVFPKQIGKVDFANASQNEIQTLPVTVVYDYRETTK